MGVSQCATFRKTSFMSIRSVEAPAFWSALLQNQGKAVEVEVFCDCDAKWTVATRVRLALMVQVRRCLEPLFFAV